MVLVVCRATVMGCARQALPDRLALPDRPALPDRLHPQLGLLPERACNSAAPLDSDALPCYSCAYLWFTLCAGGQRGICS